ncbi:MAG: Nif3-like dinuclear metal center hexameric protein [Synergistes sp.]|nr:Nif3-like dinuclear metal center hexameric protein [Synergistes sp.]
MLVKDIVERIEKRIPKCWAEEWDNPGLLVGDPEEDVKAVAVALNATPDTVLNAANACCNLLVTHHPLIFHPLKSVTAETIVGCTVIAAIKNNVALYGAHTNWDFSPEGVNVILASRLGLQNIEPLAPAKNGAWGVFAAGDLPEPIKFFELEPLLREKWNLKDFTLYGDADRIIKRIAVGGGSGGDYWRDAAAAGADCYITSDMHYNARKEAVFKGLLIAATDHGETERVSLQALSEIVAEVTGLPVTIVDEEEASFIHGKS